MVIDSSAIVAILAMEPDAPRYARAIEQSLAPRISAATLLEVCLVLTRWFGDDVQQELDQFVQVDGAQIVPFDALQSRLAGSAFLKFGKGRHRASLNFGDCISYALAKASGDTLLFKGDDFNHTDIESAL